MKEKRRRYRAQEDEALQLGDVLEPYEQQSQYEEDYDMHEEGNDAFAYDEAPYDDDPYADYPQQDDYSDYHEEMDSKARFKVAMGVFDTVSILVGVLVIFVLIGVLMTLFNWLRSDILHSVLLLQSGLS